MTEEAMENTTQDRERPTSRPPIYRCNLIMIMIILALSIAGIVIDTTIEKDYWTLAIWIPSLAVYPYGWFAWREWILQEKRESKDNKQEGGESQDNDVSGKKHMKVFSIIAWVSSLLWIGFGIGFWVRNKDSVKQECTQLIMILGGVFSFILAACAAAQVQK